MLIFLTTFWVGSAIKSSKIRTITATCRLKLNFERLKNHPDAEYEPELYPALTKTKGKAVVYHSGKINLVGIKSISDVDLLFNEIKQKIEGF